MTDKEKFRKEVEKLKSSLIHGACSSQIAMETRCKEEAYNEVLAILDSLQEEPVSEVWHDANEEQPEEYRTVVAWNPIIMDGEVLTRCAEVYKGRIWAYIEDLLNLSNVQRTVKNWKEEPVNRNPADVESAMQELEEKSRVFTEAHKGEDTDTILAQMRGEEPVGEDLGEYIDKLSKQFPEVSFAKLSRIAVRVAKWQKEHLWKHADGDDLPEIDREVIALLDNGKVVFAHRPPEYWDGKNIVTGKVTRNYPKTYDKGGWNIPDVKWWLDCLMPKVKED